ncbi:MAG: tRNA dihydrouridine synthase [Candidatus Thorarchaeota archaeon]
MNAFSRLFSNISHPIILAPMAGVTHLPFRLLCRELGANAVITELISVQSLFYNLIGEKSSNKLKSLIATTKMEKPIGLQIFGHSSSHFKKLLSKLDLIDLGFDFLDLNVGCPVPKVCNPGAGSRLLDSGKISELESIIKVITSTSPDIPFSIKIRSGYKQPLNIRKFSEMINQFELLMVTIHPRTAFQKYSTFAAHSITSKLVDYCHHPVIANGDIDSLVKAEYITTKTNCAGTMIGRAARKHPWIFNPKYQEKIPNNEFSELLKRYVSYCIAYGYPTIAFIREILVHMIRGFPFSSDFRERIIKLQSMEEIRVLINNLGDFLVDNNIDIFKFDSPILQQIESPQKILKNYLN